MSLPRQIVNLSKDVVAHLDYSIRTSLDLRITITPASKPGKPFSPGKYLLIGRTGIVFDTDDKDEMIKFLSTFQKDHHHFSVTPRKIVFYQKEYKLEAFELEFNDIRILHNTMADYVSRITHLDPEEIYDSLIKRY